MQINTYNYNNLKDIVRYDPHTGELYNKVSERKLTVDDQGFVTVYDSVNKKRIKMKAERLCMILFWNFDDTKDERILFKNLNERDYRAVNLQLVPRETYKKIMEAYRNLSGDLKLTPHPNDQYSYIITYQDEGKVKNVTVYDIVIARKKYLALQLKYAKILNKYCIFD